MVNRSIIMALKLKIIIQYINDIASPDILILSNPSLGGFKQGVELCMGEEFLGLHASYFKFLNMLLIRN